MILKDIYHRLLPLIGAIIYGFPSKKIFVIGVTGTKGKTTVTELVNAGLEASGYKTAVNNSVRHKIDGLSEQNKTNSMPGRFFLQKFLRKAVNSGCKYAVIEVTSEGIKQHRHERIEFDMAVFTNLHPEHIESHGGFEKYREAKVDFFRYVKKYSKKPNKYFFVNREDENSKYFADAVSPSDITYFKKSDLPSGLLGDFNKSNVGVAEAVLKKIGIKDAVIFRAIADFGGVPGRMEFIQKEPFSLIVDYAHTPESLEAVYETLSGLNAPRKIISVFGSFGGGRDKWKRPKMGEIASRYCREIILCDEGPFEEDANQILSEIESGILASKSYKSKAVDYTKINDRREAIKKAVSIAGPGDIILITGKGTEAYIDYGAKGKMPWMDSVVARETLKEYNKSTSI